MVLTIALGGSCVRTRCGAAQKLSSDRAAASNSGRPRQRALQAQPMAWIATRTKA